MRYEWRIGDRFFDTEYPLAGMGEVLDVNECNLIVNFESKKGYGSVFIDDPDIVPAEIYDSPLYKALREEK